MRSSPQKPAVSHEKCRPAAGRIGVNFLGAPSVSSRHMTHEMNVYFFVSLSGRNSPPNSRGSSRWGQKKSLFFAAHLPSGGRRIRILNFWYKWDFFFPLLCSADSPPFFAVGGRNIGTTRKATGSLIGSTHTQATPGPTFGVSAADSRPLESLAELATAEVTAKSTGRELNQSGCFSCFLTRRGVK